MVDQKRTWAKSRVWVNYIFALKMIVENCLEKGRKLCAAFMDFGRQMRELTRRVWRSFQNICGVAISLRDQVILSM